MGFFDKFKKAAGAATESVRADLAGNMDFLEGVCAGIALVSAADGDIEDAEKKKALEVVKGHAKLGKMYQSAQIEECMTKMLALATTVSGRLQLGREIEEVRTRLQDRAALEDVIATMVDIAASDGEIEPQELKVIASVAGKLGLGDFAKEMLAEVA
jgi:tellurite resistance protein